MKLNLKRPLAFFDLEATGITIGSDRIVEIAVLKVFPDGSKEMKNQRINPEMPIPLETSLIHGIYDEDIKDAPTFKQAGPVFAAFLEGCDLAGYNSNKFDIPMLMDEFLRVGVPFDLDNRKFVDVQNVFHQMEQRTLKAAYRFYCGKDIENAHSADADTTATYEVLLGQLERYKETEFKDKKGNVSVPVQNDIDALHKFTNLHNPVDFAGRLVFNDKGIEVFNFGKHKGKCVEDVFHAEPSYYSWMQNGDFPLYTKKCLEKIWVKWNEKKVLIKKSTEKKVVAEIVNVPVPNHSATPRLVAPKKDNDVVRQKNQEVAKPKEPDAQRSLFNKNEPAAPLTDSMLEELKKKFGK
ncbi:3'-5' exonuclease [Arcticibacter eurypsychrophilus]|uniref:3'-5' exonuclease n=1 Tax=Arcticibacter eurypsychrophilus TaxID=1434752 RepID=UPI00084D4CC3|nr:3'-5' exonuclease [Arcticibacter eurypsychrophilus]